VLLVSGDNDYTGLTTVSQGTLRLGHANALGTTAGGTTVAPAATLDLNGQAVGNEAVSIAGTGPGNIGTIQNSSTATAASLSGPVTLTANASVGGAGNLTLSGLMTDGASTFALSKVGTGTLTLSNPTGNTFNGPVAVSAGTLVVANTSGSGTGTGAVSVANNATLAGTGFITGATTVNAGGTLRGGFAGGTSAEAIGTLTLANTTLNGGVNRGTLAVDLNGGDGTANSKLAFGSGNTFNLVNAGTNKFDIELLNDTGLTAGNSYILTLATGGSYQRNGTPWNAGSNPFTAADFNLVSGSGSWSFTGVSLGVDSGNLVLQFTLAPVPEPATVLGIAALGLAAIRLRRRAAHAGSARAIRLFARPLLRP
jgi:autotransporter-associated beta strand protein